MEDPRGCYLCDFKVDDEAEQRTGVGKKVASQVACLDAVGLPCRLVSCLPPASLVHRGLGTLPGVPDLVDWPDLESLDGLDYLYIRRPVFASRQFVGFLREFKRRNPGSLVLLELPTYPYEREMMNPRLALALLKDRKYRKRLASCVDYVVDFTGHDRIFGIPVIPAMNGIDMEGLSPRAPSYEEGRIEIAFSANFSFWHGADRLLRGLSRYRHSGGKREVVVHLAGGGPEAKRLERLVPQLELGDAVRLHGPLDPDGLDEMFDACTLAVDSLGLHRRDVGDVPSGSLKSREYLARGIPSIYAGTIDVFRDHPVDFALRLPSDESPIDFERVLAFYDELYCREPEQDLIARIRKYGEEHVAMASAMANVIDVLKGIRRTSD